MVHLHFALNTNPHEYAPTNKFPGPISQDEDAYPQRNEPNFNRMVPENYAGEPIHLRNVTMCGPMEPFIKKTVVKFILNEIKNKFLQATTFELAGLPANFKIKQKKIFAFLF